MVTFANNHINDNLEHPFGSLEVTPTVKGKKEKTGLRDPLGDGMPPLCCRWPMGTNRCHLATHRRKESAE